MSNARPLPATLQAALAAGRARAQTPLRVQDVAAVAHEALRALLLAPAVQQSFSEVFERSGALGDLPRSFSIATSLGHLAASVDPWQRDPAKITLEFSGIGDQEVKADTSEGLREYLVGIRDVEDRLLSLNDGEGDRFAVLRVLLGTSSGRPECGAYLAALQKLLKADPNLAALGFSRVEQTDDIGALFLVNGLSSVVAGNGHTSEHPWVQAAAQGAQAASATAFAFGVDLGEMLTEHRTRALLADGVHRLGSDVPFAGTETQHAATVKTTDGTIKLQYLQRSTGAAVLVTFPTANLPKDDGLDVLLSTATLPAAMEPTKRAQQRFHALSGGNLISRLAPAVNAGLATTRAAEFVPGVSFKPCTGLSLTFPAEPV